MAKPLFIMQLKFISFNITSIHLVDFGDIVNNNQITKNPI
ncbi:hypothetical protein SYNTR_0109 [Candidatus Syntrophocurvum alkaliphilum]|uniref:Uncharacterized protein n=1 Tax=Candidatus Syntrophocurvum alkaliphilum TaxID=2293317 RepID=A0A6I6DCV2_9FIRM|nr:hypothetical protein SYNTR_0109 [Candidatus Syntrophocurvum alkaliphilum]